MAKRHVPNAAASKRRPARHGYHACKDGTGASIQPRSTEHPGRTNEQGFLIYTGMRRRRLGMLWPWRVDPLLEWKSRAAIMRAGNGYRSWLPGETAHARAGECLSRAGTLLPSLSAETAMTELIAHLGRTLRADRCRMFEYDGDLLRFRNSHEWCALGVGSHLADLQDTPVAIIAWLHRDLLAGRTVMIDDVAALPAPRAHSSANCCANRSRACSACPSSRPGDCGPAWRWTPCRRHARGGTTRRPCWTCARA